MTRGGGGRLLIVSAVFVFLFFGAGLSTASAWQPGAGVGFSGRFSGHGSRFGFRSRGFHHRAFIGRRHAFFAPHFRGGHRFFARPFPRRFRLVRIRVFDPFPHFVWRRVYFAPPVFADPFYAPY